MDSHLRAIVERHSTRAPVDVASVAKEMGLSIFTMSLPPGISGMIARSNDTPSGFVIYVDDEEPSYRQRFTAAHEIGHYVLHRDSIGDGIQDNYLLRAEGMSNRQEQEANRFAADLLMPFTLINKEMREGNNTVEGLAKAFDVSRIAMAIRLGVPT